MSKQIRWVIILAGFCYMLGMILYQGLSVDYQQHPSALLNKRAPKFKVSTLLDDRIVTDAVFKDNFTVLNVWASWCSTCVHEHHFWNALIQGVDKPLFQLIGMNYRDKVDNARAYLERTGNPFHTILSDTSGKLGIEFGIYGTPQTFLINPDGIVIYKHIGPVSEEVWLSEFSPRIRGVA